MRLAYGALGRGDFEGVMEMVHSEVVIRDRPELPDPRTYRGHAGVREALQGSFDAFDSFEFDAERFVVAGDRVVVVVKMTGRGRESGVPVEARIAHLWTLRDGRAHRLQVYSDPEQAIADARAAGAADADSAHPR